MIRTQIDRHRCIAAALAVACLVAGCRTLPKRLERRISSLSFEDTRAGSVVVVARLSGVRDDQGAPGLVRILHWEHRSGEDAMPCTCSVTGWIAVGEETDYTARIRLKGLKSGTRYEVLAQGSTRATRQVQCGLHGRFVTSDD